MLFFNCCSSLPDGLLVWFWGQFLGSVYGCSNEGRNGYSNGYSNEGSDGGSDGCSNGCSDGCSFGVVLPHQTLNLQLIDGA